MVINLSEVNGTWQASMQSIKQTPHGRHLTRGMEVGKVEDGGVSECFFVFFSLLRVNLPHESFTLSY